MGVKYVVQCDDCGKIMHGTFDSGQAAIDDAFKIQCWKFGLKRDGGKHIYTWHCPKCWKEQDQPP